MKYSQQGIQKEISATTLPAFHPILVSLYVEWQNSLSCFKAMEILQLSEWELNPQPLPLQVYRRYFKLGSN